MASLKNFGSGSKFVLADDNAKGALSTGRHSILGALSTSLMSSLVNRCATVGENNDLVLNPALLASQSRACYRPHQYLKTIMKIKIEATKFGNDSPTLYVWDRGLSALY
jgi:hypothetical protein